MKAALYAGVAVYFVFLTACSTAPTTASGQNQLDQEARQCVEMFKNQDPGLRRYFDSAAGYAIFPKIGEGAAGIGGAYGKGEVVERGQRTGYCDMSQGTIGAQLGGQEYCEVIFFETQDALNRFKQGNFTFAAEATAVALKSGASENAKYANGVLVFTATQGGLMAQAAIGGQKFNYVGSEVRALTGAPE